MAAFGLRPLIFLKLVLDVHPEVSIACFHLLTQWQGALRRPALWWAGPSHLARGISQGHISGRGGANGMVVGGLVSNLLA